MFDYIRFSLLLFTALIASGGIAAVVSQVRITADRFTRTRTFIGVLMIIVGMTLYSFIGLGGQYAN